MTFIQLVGYGKFWLVAWPVGWLVQLVDCVVVKYLLYNISYFCGLVGGFGFGFGFRLVGWSVHCGCWPQDCDLGSKAFLAGSSPLLQIASWQVHIVNI